MDHEDAILLILEYNGENMITRIFVQIQVESG